METILKGRGLSPGVIEGNFLISEQPFSISSAFTIPLVSGSRRLKVADRTHDFYRKNVKDKVLIFPYPIGTTTLGFVLLETIVRGIGPKAIICEEAEPLMSSGGLIADIFFDIQFPIVDQIKMEDLLNIPKESRLQVDGDKGIVKIL